MSFQRIGVVGCGLMGRGIAEVNATNGYHVIVTDVESKFLENGREAIGKSLQRAVDKGKITAESKAAALGKIVFTVDTNVLRDCDLIVEAVVENLELKKRIFSDLDKKCSGETILATNTSCLSVTDLAAATSRSDRVLGCHFFNPVPVMKLLEIVKTLVTSQSTLDSVLSWGNSIGKTTVVAPDRPGFIVNRAYLPYMVEAIEMYEDGVASKEDIDTGIQLGLNYPMGPLTLADMAGLDTVLFVLDAIYAETRSPKFVAPILLRKMVTAGQLGRKTGKGFYDYK
jgi:3-hydroxybutyryl-CoA dehydrogenase